MEKIGCGRQSALDKKGIRYRRHENAFVFAAEAEEIKKTTENFSYVFEAESSQNK